MKKQNNKEKRPFFCPHHPSLLPFIEGKIGLGYSERYDSFYCKKCMVWLERGCSDEECEFCSERPGFPEKEA